MFPEEETAMSTPSEYAPGYYVQSPSRGSSHWPWVAVALIVAIGAVAVAFMLTIGKQQNSSGLRLAAVAHRPPATKVITRTVPGTSTTVIREVPSSSAAPTAYGSAAGSCGAGIDVNGNTSCEFAQNVVDQYSQEAESAGGPGSFAVYAYSPVTGQNYTDTCTYSTWNGMVSCSHGSDLIQFAYADAALPAASSEPSASTSGGGSCGSGISINSNTSCQFAQNVVDDYMSEAEAGSPGSLAVQAYSPVTGKNYTDTCTYTSSNGMVSCSHGSDLIQFSYASQ
jgi:hypothetical protein